MINNNRLSYIKEGVAGILLLLLTRPMALAMNKSLLSAALLLCTSIALTPVYGQYQMENLSRSVVAVNVGSGKVYIGWRYLGTDPTNISFNVYRNNTRINSSPVTNSTNYIDTRGNTNAQYSIREVINGVESGSAETTNVWNSQYLTVDLQRPAGGRTPDGVSYDYSPNDLSVADLDGDSEYEIIVKWYPSNAKDNAQSGYTGNVYLDAYEMSGDRLWRIDFGRNIRAGAHYTQFIAYDLDGDGRAEVACKTADATIDGQGKVIGNGSADYRNSAGRILSGPEYLTIFDGQSGRALATTDYVPARGNVSSWGDNYGNRVDRFLAGVAYLDGQRPSLIMSRGYYTRAVIAAWDWRNGSLTNRWTFDSNNSGNSAAAGQGAHSLTIGDVDQDGRQEIVYGAATIDDNGRLLYSTRLCHGDALHLGDFNPDRDGLEVFMVHESPSCYGNNGIEMHDARTGSILWGKPGNGDIGRGLTADIDPRYRGSEAWASSGGMNSATGQNLGSSRPSINFAVWWDADPLREILDKTVIDKWNVNKSSTDRLLTANNYGAASNNGTKANPGLTADIFGDWREEVIWRHTNNKQLLIFTTTDVTDMRQFTLMHDPQYRVAVAWQNAGYNQPPHPGFYLGGGMSTPPQPNIYVAGGSNTPNPPSDPNPSSGVTIEENATGYCGADGSIDSNHTGFNGSGFANTDNEISNGIEWQISVPDSGRYTLSWRYANGSSSNRTAQVMVDGSTVVSSVSFQSTGLWNSWSSASTDVTLSAGNHRIRLQASMSGGLANIDNLTIAGNNPQAADCNGNSPQDPGTGSAAVILKAVGGNGKVDLSWTVTGDLTDIQVYRDTDADPHGRIRQAVLSSDARSYTDNTVVNGQQYWYWIKYTDTADDIGNSNAGSATPGSNSNNDTPPPVPTSEFCALARENNNLTLKCPSGSVITGVNFASYGTPGGSCGSFSVGSCNANSSESVVSDACKGKNSCTLTANNTTFGDPCYGTVKGLAAAVSCGTAAGTNTSNECGIGSTTAYYVDAANGNDGNAGTSPQSPWRSLTPANNHRFTAGEHLCLRAGGRWTGELSLQGSGTAGSPIVVGQYDEGNKPKIDAQGKALQALLLRNVAYVEVSDLELTNNAGRPGDFRGVSVRGRDAGQINHVVLRDLFVHDVSGVVNWIGGDAANSKPPWIHFKTGWDASKRTGGIVFETEAGSTVRTWFNDVIIVDSVIQDTSFGGIIFKQLEALGGVRRSVGDTNFRPHTNIVIRDNYLSQSNTDYGCNTIYVTGAQHVLIEGNVTKDAGTSAIEAYNSDDVVIQHNETYGTVTKAGGADSNGIDADRATTNTIIQYNYVHDNGDGILLCQFGFGDSVVRYNVVANSSRMAINLHSNDSARTQIYNNLFYGNTKLTDSSGGSKYYSGNYPFYNNIFYGTGRGATVVSGGNITYTNNLFHNVSPVGNGAVTGDPLFAYIGSWPSGNASGSAIDSLTGLMLQSSSPAINKGRIMNNNGGIDFFGNPLYAGTPDIGPHEFLGDGMSVPPIPDVDDSSGSSSLQVELESLSNQSDFSPFEVQNNSGVQYIVWPGSGGILNRASDSAAGQLAIDFTLSQPTDVEFQVRVNMPDDNSDSFYYKIDSAAWSTQNNEQTSGWSTLTPATFHNLSPGTHTLTIKRREDGTQLDLVTLNASAGGIARSSLSN